MPPAKYLTADEGKRLAKSISDLDAALQGVMLAQDALAERLDSLPSSGEATDSSFDASDAMARLMEDVASLREQVDSLPADTATDAPTTISGQPVAGPEVPRHLGLLEADVTDGGCTVRIRFADEVTAARAINTLRRKVLTSGINVDDGRGTIHCFRSISRVSFSTALLKKHPFLAR
jgi:hypothetical protein